MGITIFGINDFHSGTNPRNPLQLWEVRDQTTNQRTREIFRRLVQVAAEHGWGEYRTHTAFMDDCAAAYSFNDHALRRLHETLKDAIDPNGIISAGRYGIWPKHLR